MSQEIAKSFNKNSSLWSVGDINIIIRLVAATISENQYQTCKELSPTVFCGVLLEYHPNGTLDDALRNPKVDVPWARWALQITIALNHFHKNGSAHIV